MEANSPFHHPSLFKQCLSFSNTTAATTTVIGCSGEFHQPHDQAMPNGSIEVSAHDHQASIGNNIQNSHSSLSMVAHDNKFEKKASTTNSSFNNAQSRDMAKKSCKRWRKQKKDNDDQENTKKMREVKEEEKSGYIHVRARRGEATDSHSLAERVRREKISEKMKTLQAIVPGCDKITGKALMLDEVINYVHSLQNEIQILSFKLASVNPMFGVDSDASMLTPDQEQLMMLLQEDQMPCMISQNNEEIMWDIGEQRQELDDLFAIINNFNTF